MTVKSISFDFYLVENVVLIPIDLGRNFLSDQISDEG